MLSQEDLGYYQPTMKQETQQAPSRYAHTQSKRRRNPRNMGLSSKSQLKGRGYEFLARSQQRNHGYEFLAKAHNGGYTQSNLQRSHDHKSLERICRKAIPIIICSRKYMGSNCACNGTKPKHAQEVTRSQILQRRRISTIWQLVDPWHLIFLLKNA